MKRVKSLFINSFDYNKTGGKVDTKYIVEKLSNIPFSEEDSFGFSQVELEDNVLSGRVLKRTPTFIQDYDNESGEIVKKKIFLYSDSQFFIDFNISIIYVNGGATQMNNIKSSLRNSFDFEYQLGSIDLNAPKFHELLSDKQVDFSIEQIIINNFSYDAGIIGRFSGHVTNQTVGSELVSEYKSDIVKLLFKINLEGEDLLIQVFQNGSIKFLAEENEFEYYTSYIKSLIFS